MLREKLESFRSNRCILDFTELDGSCSQRSERLAELIVRTENIENQIKAVVLPLLGAEDEFAVSENTYAFLSSHK